MKELSNKQILKRIEGWKSKIQRRIGFYWYDDDEQAVKQIRRALKKK